MGVLLFLPDCLWVLLVLVTARGLYSDSISVAVPMDLSYFLWLWLRRMDTAMTCSVRIIAKIVLPVLFTPSPHAHFLSNTTMVPLPYLNSSLPPQAFHCPAPAVACSRRGLLDTPCTDRDRAPSICSTPTPEQRSRNMSNPLHKTMTRMTAATLVTPLDLP